MHSSVTTTHRMSTFSGCFACLTLALVGCGNSSASQPNNVDTAAAGSLSQSGGRVAMSGAGATTGGSPTTGGTAAAGGTTDAGSSAGGNNWAGGSGSGGSNGAGGTNGGGTGGMSNGGSAGAAPVGLSFVPPEGVTSVALSVHADGVVLPMKLHNGNAASASISALSIASTDAFKLEQPPTLPVDIAPGADLPLSVRFAPTAATTTTFDTKLTATSTAGSPSAGLFGLAMSAQNTEPTLAQVVHTLGYKIDVGSSGIALGTGSALLGEEVAASRFSKAGAAPVGFQVVARYSPFEAAAYGYYTGTLPNVTRAPLGVMSKGDADNIDNRTLFPPLDAGALSSFDPGAAPFGLFAESQSNTASLGADGRLYKQNAFNDDQVNVLPVHRFRVYPLKNRSGQAVPNSFVIACEEASNSDYQDYVFLITGVSVAK